jgi:polyisoprenoid-binding protein YceI
MLKIYTIILLLAMSCFSVGAKQTYHLDIKKSKVLWDTRKTMGGHHGYLLFKSGSLDYTAAGEPKYSTDHAHAAGNKKVDEELKKEGFFATERYPEATMTVKEITHIGRSANFKVAGLLTIKGIANPVEFSAAIIKKKDLISATANTSIDRVKWNIDMQPKREAWDFVSALKNTIVTDEIAISLNLTFTAN